MPYQRPFPGQPAAPYVGQSGLWADIIQMLSEWQAGDLTNRRGGSGSEAHITVRSTESFAIKAGQICEIELDDSPDFSGWTDLQIQNYLQRPLYKIKTATWGLWEGPMVIPHRNINPGETTTILRSGIVPAKGLILGATGWQDGDNGWAFIDETSQLTISEGSGLWKVLSTVNIGDDDWLMLDLSQSQRLFMFEALEDAPDYENSPGARGEFVVDILDLSEAVRFGTDLLQDPHKLLGKIKTGDRGVCLFDDGYFVGGFGGPGFSCEDLCDCPDYIHTLSNEVCDVNPPPPCEDGTRIGAKITMSGWPSCQDDGKENCNTFRDLTFYNGTWEIPIPDDFPNTTQVILDLGTQLQMAGCTGLSAPCNRDYSLKFQVDFGCGNPGGGDTLGYRAVIYLDPTDQELRFDSDFNNALPLYSPLLNQQVWQFRGSWLQGPASVGCCVQAPAGQSDFLDTIDPRCDFDFMVDS